MIRWIAVCVLLSACAVAAVWAVAPKTIVEDKASPPSSPAAKAFEAQGAPAADNNPTPRAPATLPGVRPTPELVEYKDTKQAASAEPIHIYGCRLVIDPIQEVPTEKEGKIAIHRHRSVARRGRACGQETSRGGDRFPGRPRWQG